MSVRRGCCQCGQLTLTASGDPLRVTVCHCFECQRQTGSAFGLFARFPRERIRMTGEARTRRRDSDAGETRVWHFCPACGGTVWFELSAHPTLVSVPVGIFADPAFPGPTHSVFESRRPSWVRVPIGAEHRE